MRRLAQKKRCLQHRALIVSWLRLNYCLKESGSIAKRDVFVHYIDLCRANRVQPSSAASFGKILKIAFPSVKCNRVGPRGASKHHYRGLVLRDGYVLSFDGVEPISDAAINEMMKNMKDEDGEGDDDDDDEEDFGGKIKSESSSPSQQHLSSPLHQHASTHSVSSSPPSHGGHHGQHQPPTSGHFATAATAYQPLDGMYQQSPLNNKQFVLPAPQPHYLPQPHNPGHLQHHLQQHHQPQQHHHQVMMMTQADGKNGSFSWISPEMDPSSYSKRPAGFPVLPPPSYPGSAPAALPPSVANVAFKEWAEKRDLVEFCDRNFHSLYDSILRTNCGEGKDQVLSHVVAAWQNLRQYTKHMNLFSAEPAASVLYTTSTDATGRRVGHDGGEPTSSPGERGRTREDERYNQQGEDLVPREEELKSKMTHGGPTAMPQHHHHQYLHHQALPLPHHHFQQQQQQQHSPQQAPRDKRSPSSSSPPSASHPDHLVLPHHQQQQQQQQHFVPPPLVHPSMPFSGTPPLASFTGSSSSLSLSWLNPMAFSMGGPRTPTLPSPTPLSGPNTSAVPYLPDLGNRGNLEGLEYRSFEWKGSFE